MAEGMAAETNPERIESAAEDMDLVEDSAGAADGAAKRAREEGDGEEGDVGKKQKVEEKSAEEERLEKIGGEGAEEEEAVVEEPGPVVLGPKTFGSSVEMFDYFINLLRNWPPNININKYEQLVLMDLLKKGHPEPDKKIGAGIQAFQVRYHRTWKSRCFFLIREDDSVDDFSFRKCVDQILPLPEDMKVKPDSNKLLSGGKDHGGKGGGARGGRGGGRGHGHGRGRGGKFRN